MTFPPVAGCSPEFDGFSGDLSKALDKTNAAYQPAVAQTFRQWVTLCTITNAEPGTYVIQVKTNGVRTPRGGQRPLQWAQPVQPPGLRFVLADDDAISVAGYNKMAMYANTPNGTSKFYLARVPSGARGQMLNVRLYDIGDGAKSRQHDHRPAADGGRRDVRGLHGRRVSPPGRSPTARSA